MPDTSNPSISPPNFEHVFTRGYMPYVWFFVIIFAVYAQTLFFGFTSLDDWYLISARQEFLRNPLNIFEAFRENIYGLYYRPLLTISFIIDTVIGRGSFVMYHFTNLVLHFAGTAILYVLLKELGGSKKFAFCFASIFAAHPILTSSVSWVPGRNDSMLGVFVFSAFLMLVKYVKTQKNLHLVLFTLLAAASMFTKESAIGMVIIFPAYILLFGFNEFKVKNVLRKKFALPVVFLYASVFVWFLCRSMFAGSVELSDKAQMITEGISKIVPAFFQYLGKLIIPVNNSGVTYFEPFSIYFGVFIFVCLACLIPFAKIKNKKLLALGALWIFLFIAPPIFQKTPYVLEHRMYVVFAGIAMIMGALTFNFSKKFFLCLWAVFLVFYMCIAGLNAQKFKNEQLFASSVILQSPSLAAALYIAGEVSLSENGFEMAHHFFKRGVELEPHNSDLNFFIGFIYWAWGNFDKSREHLIRALERNPTRHQGWAILANIAINDNNPALAVYYMENALRHNPQDKQYLMQFETYREIKYALEK